MAQPAWRVTAEPERFVEAVEWFRSRFPITPELAEILGAYAGPRAWTIAGVAQLDILLAVFESLSRAIARGTPFHEWQDEVEDELTQAWGRRNSGRMETIFRNATQQALNAGRWRQMTHPAVKAIRPYGLFDGIDDARQTPICRAADRTILPLDDPWWDTHSPQLHHRCRSSIRNITAREAERRGGQTAAPTQDTASEGFGKKPDTAAWEPKPADYPSELFDTYRLKRAELERKAKRRIPEPDPESS